MLGDPNVAGNALQNLLQPYSEEQFQKGVIDPTMRDYQRSVLPSIQQRFSDVGASSSSALNQALAKSAEDLSTVLGSQRQSYQQMSNQANLGALSQLMGLTGVKQFEPMVQAPRASMGPEFLQAGAAVLAKILPMILAA